MSEILHNPLNVVYFKYSAAEVEAWRTKKAFIASLAAGLGTLAGAGIGGIGMVIGGPMGSIITEGVYAKIESKHMEFGRKGLIIRLRYGVPHDDEKIKGAVLFMVLPFYLRLAILDPAQWGKIERELDSDW